MSGWKVKVTVAGQPARFYAVGEGDPKAALILANKVLKTSPPRDRLETDSSLSDSVLEYLGVKAGEIKELSTDS